MQNIIGRCEEKILLEEAFSSKSAEFIAVYGRRRIGKTYLIHEFFKAKKCMLFHITGIQEGILSDQIYSFTRILETVFYASQIQIKEPETWIKAFELLTSVIRQHPSNAKMVLFFDELPWLASQKSGFIKALDYYWNRFWSHMPNIKLIVCGSAASWMIENILHHKGGLHNRITRKMTLDAFGLRETRDYLKAKGFHYTEQQILEIYMVIGGIPYYLNFLDKRLSVPQNIDALCFHKKGMLIDEFTVLFASLFNHYEAHQEIIRLMAKKRQGIERTALLKMTRLSSDGGTFNKRLKELETSGFITNFVPYGRKKRNIFYQIIDEYTLFYLTWIEPDLSIVKKIAKPNGYWIEQSKTPSWKSWAGYAFEAVCFKHLEQVKTALKVNPNAWAGSWKYIPKGGTEETGAQVDLLFDRNDDVITLCEIKYTHTAYKLTKAEAQILLRKREVFTNKTATPKQVTMALITSVPMQKTLYTEEMITANVTLKHLLK